MQGQIHSKPDNLSHHPIAVAVLNLSNNMVLQGAETKGTVVI